MKIKRRTLIQSWLATGVAAVAVFVVMALMDSELRYRTGMGTREFQAFATATQVATAFGAWSEPSDAALAGFLLGLDYLFIPLWGVAMFLSGIIVREAFAPSPPGAPGPSAGSRRRLRRILDLAALVPVAGALCDAIENGLEMAMWLVRPQPALAYAAFSASNIKIACFSVGIVLTLAAIASFVPRFGRGTLPL